MNVSGSHCGVIKEFYYILFTDPNVSILFLVF